MSDILVVSVFGREGLNLVSEAKVPDFEENRIECRCYSSDESVMRVIDTDDPGVVLTFGDPMSYPELMNAPYEVRRKWVNLDNKTDDKSVGGIVFSSYIRSVCNIKKDVPLVTVFTPAYKTGSMIKRPMTSLMAQSYTNWEWVVMDDSDGDETFKILSEMASEDSRVRPYRSDKHLGKIGALKRDACGLARGSILVEMDHDDELTPWALQSVVEAYEKMGDEVGFVYTDFAEVMEDGAPVRYPEGWGLGYGSYREEIYNGHPYAVVNSPNINSKTIRHIVAAPNHIRSWRKSVYDAVGGHNPDLHVVDDYELMLRTFLATRMCRVPRMCYVQYRNDRGNTHKIRNKEIQRLVRHISVEMDRRIHDRLVELGVDDFIWQKGMPSFYRMGMVPNPEKESHCTLTL